MPADVTLPAASPPTPSSRPLRRLGLVALRVLTPVCSVMALWYLAIWFSGLPAFVIPRPERVIEVLLVDYAFIFEHLMATLEVAAVGFLWANVAGIGLAVLFDLLPPTRHMLMPAAITLRNVPYIALISVLMLAFGDSILSKTAIVALAGFFPVLVNTMAGLRAADEVQLDRMRILNASWWQTFSQVRLPYAIPSIVAAQEITGSGSIIVAIAAEWMISSTGLGYVINNAMQNYRGDKVYAVALLATALSFLIYSFVHWLGQNWIGGQATRGVRTSVEANMAAGLSAEKQAMPASIPVVDIGALYGNDPAAKKAVAAKIGAACDDIGFFYAVNHNVPVETIDHAVAMADRFFCLPEAERLKVKSDKNNRGYREVGDVVHRNGKPSARDNFDLGFPVTEDDPEVKAGTPLYAPNKWPDVPGFKEALETYYWETYKLGMKILEGFAIYLGKPEDFFSRHFTRPVADMVINHYLGAAGLHISDQASGPHTDHGIVTILWQDDLGGLEVMGKDGNWIHATPLRGSYVINIGELMKRWTNGRFKATIHRVVHLQNKSRYSMPLFCNPNFRTIVDPRDLGISDADAQYPPVMSGDFLLSRFKATRKLWGAEEKGSVSNDDKLIEAAVE